MNKQTCTGEQFILKMSDVNGDCEYKGSIEYPPNTIVRYKNELWITKRTVQGVAPMNNGGNAKYWQQLTADVSDLKKRLNNVETDVRALHNNFGNYFYNDTGFSNFTAGVEQTRTLLTASKVDVSVMRYIFLSISPDFRGQMSFKNETANKELLHFNLGDGKYDANHKIVVMYPSMEQTEKYVLHAISNVDTTHFIGVYFFSFDVESYL